MLRVGTTIEVLNNNKEEQMRASNCLKKKSRGTPKGKGGDVKGKELAATLVACGVSATLLWSGNADGELVLRESTRNPLLTTGQG